MQPSIFASGASNLFGLLVLGFVLSCSSVRCCSFVPGAVERSGELESQSSRNEIFFTLLHSTYYWDKSVGRIMPEQPLSTESALKCN